MKTFLTFTLALSPLFANAQFDVSTPRGQETLKFNTPERKQEICVIPQHSQIGAYSKSDLKDEKELCSYDFHGLTRDREVVPMALCPKLNSSNPGVLVMEIPEGWNRSQFEAEKCLIDNDLQKTEAKFKQTVTCSYTPSILTYYHVSRYLGGAGNVPAAVLRTMSKERHYKVAEQGLIGTRKVGGAIRKGWEILESSHGNTTSAPLLFDRQGEFLFGALQTNVKNEAKYYEIIGGGAYEDRYNNFVKKDFYKQLTNPRDILDVLGSNSFDKVAQPLLTLKDATDMILLDTLLTQQDRMYNQHFKWAWTWIENGKVKRQRVKAKMDDKGVVSFVKEKDKAEQAEFAAKNAVMVKELIMKDNDCGLRARFYRNRMKEVKALDGIRHMSGVTYTALLKLAQNLRNPEMGTYLKNETLMTDADLKVMLTNVFAAEETLKTKCLAGELKLDLDLDTYFSSRPEKFQCEI